MIILCLNKKVSSETISTIEHRYNILYIVYNLIINFECERICSNSLNNI